MKKLTLILFLFLTVGRGFAQNSCELFIAFSPNDCINCSIGLTQLHTFSPELKKYLIVQKNDKEFFEEFSRENLFLNKVQNLTIEYSDSLYKLHQRNNLSTCDYFINGKQIMTFPLTELLAKKSFIESISHTYTVSKSDTIRIDSLALSGRISISRGGNHIFIYDYLLNKIAILDKSGLISKSGSIAVLKPRISKIQLMEIAHLDTTVYKGTLPIFRALGKDKIRYEALYWSKDTLHTLITFYYPKFRGNDTIISAFLFLGNYANNKLVSVKYIDDSKFENDYYNFDNTMPFYVSDNGVVSFSMYVSDPLKQNTKLFSEWRSTENQHLAFSKYSVVNLPEYFIKNEKEYENYGAILRDSLYYCTTYPFIYNIKDSTEIDLSSELERIEGIKMFGKDKKQKFFMEDVIANGKIIEILYFVDTIPKIAYYDTISKRILYSEKLSLGSKLYIPSLVFLSPFVLMVMDETRKSIILYK